MELAGPTADGVLTRRRQARELIKQPRVQFALASITLLLVAGAVVLGVFLSKRGDTGTSGFTCSSEFQVNSAAAPERKGLAVDDTTFLSCPGKMPSAWPNSDKPVTSIRLFKAWDSKWPLEKRSSAWQAVVDFAKENNAKVLVGTQISCDEKADDADWGNVLQLLRMLGPEHVMGVAVGNELELLKDKDKKIVPESCVKNVWEGGYFLKKFDQHVRDLDSLGGFENVPLTSAFGAYIMAGQPFVNTPEAKVLDFVKTAIEKYGSRWVYSINIYPYFDPSNQLDAGSTDLCSQAMTKTHCFDDPNQCLFPGIVQAMRARMAAVSTQHNVLWVTETGWSTPVASTLKDKPMGACTAFSDEDSFREYYEGFLAWDLQIKGAQGPDHVFYFTIRDAANFGIEEYFGLVRDCDTGSCKLQHGGSGSPTPSPSPPGPKPPAPAPAPGGASCSAHPNCKSAGLHGNCCPTDAGMMLGCCQSAIHA